MIAALIYTLICVAGLPFWVAQQHLGGRSIPFVLASCSYVAYVASYGAGIPMDDITIAVGCIAAWLCASLIWTGTHKSVFELLNMLSYLVLFTAARQLPLVLVALIVFAVGVHFAAAQMYEIVVQKKTGKWLRFTYFAFGNGNHTGNFMLLQFFVGLWLGFNLSPWIFAFLPLIGAALVTTKCKGAMIATVIGFLALTYAGGYWKTATGISLAAVIAAFIFYCKYPYHFQISLLNRTIFVRAAFELIRKRIITGWGLMSYAKELPETKAVLTATADNSGKRTERAHNDHLELIVELGVVGYLLYVYLFLNLSYSPVTFGLIIAFAVHSCVFFPFREVHTAAPLWVILGASTGGVMVPWALPWIVKVLICCILFAAVIKTLQIFLGQWYSCRAKFKANATTEEKIACYEIALNNDPQNGGYLPDAALEYFKVNPVKAFELMARAYINYDGTRMKHQICDMFARCIINARESVICHWLEDLSIMLEHDNDSAVTVKNHLIARDERSGK